MRTLNRLLVTGGPDDGSVINLHKGVFVIGSSPQADIRLESPGISASHASLRVHNNELSIESVGRGRTYINGQPMGARPRRLTKGDRFWVEQFKPRITWEVV